MSAIISAKRSGLLAMTRDAGAPPTLPVAGSGDHATATGLYGAIVTGLYRRERTDAAKDDRVRVVLWHGAGDSFCAGNDIEDFMKNPTVCEESPQSALMSAFLAFDKPIVAAVHGVAVGGGATMLTHCDFVYAAESARFQFPFINLGLVPEFGTSCSLPAWIGYLPAAELIMSGQLFDGEQAAALGMVTRVVLDQMLLARGDRNRAEAGGEAGMRAASNQAPDAPVITRAA